MLDTSFTYCHITALRYSSTMSTCSQVELFISKALLQNNASHRNKIFSAFYYKRKKFPTGFKTSYYLPPFWASWIRSTSSHSISCNPVLIFHLHTVNCRVQSVTFHTILIPACVCHMPCISQVFSSLYLSYVSSPHVILSSLLLLAQNN